MITEHKRNFLWWSRPIQGDSVELSSISKETPNVLSARSEDSENNMASTKVIHHALARDLSTALFYKNAYVIVSICILYKVLLQIYFAIWYAFLSIFLILEIPPKPKIEKIDDDCVREPCVQPSLKSRSANIPKLEEGS